MLLGMLQLLYICLTFFQGYDSKIRNCQVYHFFSRNKLQTFFQITVVFVLPLIILLVALSRFVLSFVYSYDIIF